MITKKSSSSPLVIIIPLVVAFAVIAVVAIKSRETQQIVSKASYNGTEKCIQTCNNSNLDLVIKNSGECALDCPQVISETMSCSDFCSQNVRNKEWTDNSGTTITARQVCNNRCKDWVSKNDVPVNTPAPHVTINATPFPTRPPEQFNCTSKCSTVPTAGRAMCATVCNQFNTGERRCPNGCNSTNTLASSTCRQLFCSDQ